MEEKKNRNKKKKLTLSISTNKDYKVSSYNPQNKNKTSVIIDKQNIKKRNPGNLLISLQKLMLIKHFQGKSF